MRSGLVAAGFAYTYTRCMRDDRPLARTVGSVWKGSSPGVRVTLVGLVLVLAVPLAVDPLGYNPFGPAKALLLGIAAALVLVGLLLDPIGRVEPDSKVALSLGIAAAAYVGITALSVITSVDPLRSIVGSYPEYQGLVSLTLYVVVAAGVAKVMLADDRSATLLTRTASLVLLAVGAYAVLQRIGIDPLLNGVAAPVEEATSLRSTLGNASNLGVYLTVALPLAVFAIRRDRSLPWRVVAGAAGAVGLISVAWTGSRGAWLGVAVAAVVWGAFELRDLKGRLRTIALAVGAVVAVVALAAVLAVSGVGGRVVSTTTTTTGSAAWRLKVWAATARMISQRPLLGWGPNSFGVVYPEFRPTDVYDSTTLEQTVADAHNAPLAAAAASGVLAALALAVLLVLALAALWTAPGGQTRRSALSPALAAGLAGAATALLFHFVTLDTGPYLALLLGLTFGMAFVSVPAGDQSKRCRASARGQRVVAGLALVGVTVSIAGAGGLVTADQSLREANALAAAGAPWGALKSAGDASRAAAPWEAAFSRAQGQLATKVVAATADPAAFGDGLSALAAARAAAPLDAGADADAGVLRLTAAEAMNSERYARAAAADLRRALKRDPNNIAYWVVYGSALSRASELDAAASALERAIRLDPSAPYIYKVAARIYDAQGRAAAAAAARAKASALINGE